MGSVCKLNCPEDKVLTCAGPKEQTCLRKGNSMSLKWNTNPKCRCVSKQELENAKQEASYNCSLGLFSYDSTSTTLAPINSRS